MREITNTENIIDSRDITERITELVDLVMDEEMNGYRPDADPDDVRELKVLRDLHREGQNESDDWEYGATLVRESYFVEYTQELAEETSFDGVPRDEHGNIRWPFNHIDWDAAAEDLLVDYNEITFDGVTYYTR